ncbi:MAG: hypothetical protein ACXV8S_10945 [Methylobacter sp.]
MNIKLIKLLVSVGIGLCIVIAGEWLYARYMEHRLLASIASEEPQEYKAEKLPEIELTSQPEDSYVDLVARPLFIKGRRPVDEPVRETGQAAAKPETFDWQLTGVYSTKQTVSALFSRAKSKVAKDNHRKITVGEDLDGWKLIEINKDRAVLKQGSKEKELLLRKPKSKVPLPGANGATPATPAPTPAPAPVPPPPPESEPPPPPENNGETSEGNQ